VSRIDFNPFTGRFDLVGEGAGGGNDNFSYTRIEDGSFVTIPENQQMLYSGDLYLLGDLYQYGGLFQVSDTRVSQVSLVPENTVHQIYSNEVMFYKNLRILGDLRIHGDLVEI